MFYLVLAAVFGGTLLIVIAAYSYFARERIAAREAVRQRLLGDAAIAAAGNVSILREDRASSLEFLNRLLEGKNLTASLADQLDRAGLKQTVGAFLLTVALGGAIGFLLGRLLNPVAAVVFTVLGVLVPFVNLKRLRGKRTTAFETQLPEAIDMLVNAMKAGYSLQAAMKFVGDEMSAPLGPEFARFYDEQRLGMDVRVALLNLQGRVDTLDLKMFVTALLIQRESGGNLAEVMTNLSSVMRDRKAFRGELATLTAEPKMSAIVLGLLPVVLFVLINVMNPDYMKPMYQTPTGHLLLAYSVVSVIIGYFVLRNMGNIEV
jgi:tight adherence protein B